MKKLLAIVGAIGLTGTAATTVVSCGTTDTFDIIFIPSNNATEVINTVKPLEGKLQAEMKARAEERGETFTKKVKISTSTNYEAAGSTLAAGKADLAFLPVGTYNKNKGTLKEDGTYDKLGILLESSRDAYSVEAGMPDGPITQSDSLKYAKNYNELLDISEEENITKEQIREKYLDTKEKSAYYRSYVYVNNKLLEKQGIDISSIQDDSYGETLRKLILPDAKGDEAKGTVNFAVSKSKTSSAGTIYPLMWLKNVAKFNDQQVKYIYINSKKQENYPSAAEVVSNSESVAVGFSDIRYEIKDEAASIKAFKNTSVIGMTDKIINDGIMYSRKRVNDDKVIKDLRDSFKDLISKEENKEIFNVYNHADYIGPEGEQAPIEWETALDKEITVTSVEAEKIEALIKDL
ncbi:unknown lipoprotein [Mesoplasma florum L1]|uniref:Phosphonate ABC transporter substrate-binding protein n=1 Tax=Mesoplasma florum (strain ATCC 33453 / NBRC 100688 / NCTC 11704 / L1) TaxID=265311 RepID=Q6F0P2_MESFL|nr:lipoprotein [Mesoplasma florum]AAT75931.1 unknown lipoprotein [Mesoplasma florum L1]ATI73537.1 hypothetical protein CQZ69_03170 [Mesoplasma florum]ATI74227.1 hypothetical protein CQZ70_03200 [Mesoplasma florum]AVN61930.1 hypothetical protein CG004_03155 [Mesoplasma florum]